MPKIFFPCLVKTCNKRVVKGIECSVCLNWAHKKCTGLPDNIYTLYCSYEELEWVCHNCVHVAKNALSKANGSGHKITPNYKKPAEPKATLPSATKPSGERERSYAWSVSHGSGRLNTPAINRQTGPISHSTPMQTYSQNPWLRPKKVFKESNVEFDVFKKQLAVLTQQVMQLAAQKGQPSQESVILIHNKHEPFVREFKARKDLDLRKVKDVLRMSGIPANVGIRRIHRVGKWKAEMNGSSHARPILVEFKSAKWRDALLTKAEQIMTRSNGRYQVSPDQKPKRAKVDMPIEGRATEQCTQSGGADTTVMPQKEAIVVVDQIRDAAMNCSSLMRSRSLPNITMMQPHITHAPKNVVIPRV